MSFAPITTGGRRPTDAPHTLPTRYHRLPEVLALTGLSKSTIYRLVKDGKFPAPIKLTERTNAWVSTELDAYIAGRVAASRQAA